jgi:hypothetical protein
VASPALTAAPGRTGTGDQPDRRRQVLVFGAILLLLALCFRTMIRGDGVAYYAYLPAVVAGHTVDLQPTFQEFLDAGVPVQAENLEIDLPNGLRADYKQVGSAVLALPFYAVTTAIMGITPKTEDPVLNPGYQLSFTAAALFYALLALFLLYRFIRRQWGSWAARLAIIGSVFATPLVAYLFFEPSYNHAFSVAAIITFSLFLYLTGPERRWWQWLALGVLGGLMTMTHIQEALFLALVPAEALMLISRRRWTLRQLPGYALAGVGLTLAVVPQIAIDRLIFERWLPPSAPNISFNFLHPHLAELLTSTHHGWFSWSPLVVVAIAGLPLLVRRLGWFAVALIVIGLGEVWINAALSDWSGGLGFGSRRLTDQTLLVALSFGALFSWAQVRVPRLAVALVGGGVLWTLLLLAQFYYIIPPAATPRWGDFLLGQIHAIPYVPRLFLQGTVLRELAGGQVMSGLATGATLALLLFAILAAGRRLWPASAPDAISYPNLTAMK